MPDEKVKIFKLLETADNYIKYSKPGKRARAIDRARKRYEKAAELATGADDKETLGQIELRLADLERLVALPPDETIDNGTVEDYRGIVTSPLPEHAADRVPPGQRLTRGWPVLHAGSVPRFDESNWSLTMSGLVENEVTLSYGELRALGPLTMRADMHCVTGWSKLDNVWEGIPTRTLFELCKPAPTATHVSVVAEHDYTANLPLERLLEDDAMVAWAHNGTDLEPKHGYPLRLVIPRLYAWKSVKWVRGFELLPRDRRGFWELRGYHNVADPWREERYSYQE
jgi:DMSO/TMAO reductase YedYZ molybdopterin-dependent catalytic subunit